MTISFLSCLVCDGRAWRVREVRPNIWEHLCAKGHIWEEHVDRHLCERCGQDRGDHLILGGPEYGDILVCRPALAGAIFKEA